MSTAPFLQSRFYVLTVYVASSWEIIFDQNQPRSIILSPSSHDQDPAENLMGYHKNQTGTLENGEVPQKVLEILRGGFSGVCRRFLLSSALKRAYMAEKPFPGAQK